MKSLKILQTFAKIGKILSTIVFILSVVVGGFCIAGLLSLAVFPEGGFKLLGTTIRGLVEKEADISLPTLYAALTGGMIMCAGEAVVAKFAERYFKNELAAGTPFTFDGAKELMRLGILAICVSTGTLILAAIVYGIFRVTAENVAKPELDNSASVIIGVMMIVGSYLCRHGAEVSDKPAETV